MDVTMIAQNSANTFAPRVDPKVIRRVNTQTSHANVSISNRPHQRVGEKIETIQPSVRARYFLEFFNWVGSRKVNVGTQNIQAIMILLIAIGSLGRVAMTTHLSSHIPPKLLTGLILLQRNASEETAKIPFDDESEAICSATCPTPEEMQCVGRIAAILFKTVISTGSGQAIADRAKLSLSRKLPGISKQVLRGVEQIIITATTPERFDVWGSMQTRSDLLLMCAYAHLDGVESFAKNTSNMADDRVRQEIVSGVKTHLISIVGQHIHIGPVPSVYHAWCHYIAPYNIGSG